MSEPSGRGPAFLFDLDGTLVDSVYQHVLAWREAMAAVGIELAVWTHPPPHRHERRADGQRHPARDRPRRDRRGGGPPAAAARARPTPGSRRQVRPLPGARELLAYLTEAGVPWAIATSGRIESARPTLELLGVAGRGAGRHPRPGGARQARPRPVPRRRRAARRRHRRLVVVGDSVWDLLAARRARALGVGLLSGGYGQDELERAGAYRVYQDPADLLRHLDEVGVRPTE